jgi:dynactin complex subunit
MNQHRQTMDGEREIYVGKRLSFGSDLCTVRYIGEVQGTKGQWLGVEWDDATRGKHNGEAGAVRYFNCTVMLRPNGKY